MSVSKKRIKAKRNFGRLTDGKLEARGLPCESLKDNHRFTDIPISLDDFKSRLDTFQALRGEARFRDARVVAQKNSVRQKIISDLDMLTAYVENIADQDAEAFDSSGLEAVPSSYAGPQPLPTPKIQKIKQGITGELLAKIESLGRAALSYQLRHGVNGADPESWPVLTVVSAKDFISFDGLTPGTIYAFQVRAHGHLGFTDWSDSVTRMCI